MEPRIQYAHTADGVSIAFWTLAKGKEFLFADRGETSLRGFEDPVRLFEVRWQEES